MLLYGIVFVVMFRRIFLPTALGGEPNMFFGWDVRREYWPDLAFRFHSIWQGEWPLWNPYELGGFPFAARSHAMAYYPPAWLVLPFALPRGNLSIWGAHYFVAFHGVVGAFGAHVLSRRLGSIEPCCYLAGLTTLMAAPVLTHVDSSVYYGVNWIPWLISSLDAFTRAPGRRTSFFVACFGILAGSSGTPPAVFYVLVACVLFAVPAALVSIVRSLRGQRALSRCARHVGSLLGWGGFALVVTLLYLALIYLPNADLLSHAVRKYGDRSYVLYRALTLRDLNSLLNSKWPQTWWFDLFIGLFPLMTALPALLAPSRVTALIILAASAVSVLLGLGQDGKLLLPAVDHIPGFSLHRLPYRYASIFGTLWPAVGARGLSFMIELARDRARPWTLALRTIAGALVAASMVAVLHYNPDVAAKAAAEAHRARALVPWEAVALALLLIAPLALPSRWPLRQITWATLAAIFAIQLAHMWSSIKVRVGIIQKYDASAEVGSLKWTASAGTLWRIWPYAEEHEGVGTRRMRRYADGYPDPMEFDRHRTFMTFGTRRPELLRLFGVRFVPRYRGWPLGSLGTFVPPYGWVISNPVGPLVWYGATRRVPNGYMALNSWEQSEPKGIAVVEASDWTHALDGLKPDGGSRVEGKILRYGMNRIEGDVVAPERGLVVSNEVFADGWTVTVDGRPEELVRANYLLRAVPVPAGHHLLVFRYTPTRYRLLVPLFLGSILALSLWGSWPRVVRLVKALAHS